jgi:hypothetical protein
MSLFPQPKPAKGSSLIASRLKRTSIRMDERRVKAAVRARDKRCRWPQCQNCRDYKPRLEAAHLDPKGQGGDHGLRTSVDRLILLDHLTHQGADGLERHERKIEPLTDRGASGPCAFWVKHYSVTRPGEWRWHCVGVELCIGVLESSRMERTLR